MPLRPFHCAFAMAFFGTAGFCIERPCSMHGVCFTEEFMCMEPCRVVVIGYSHRQTGHTIGHAPLIIEACACVVTYQKLSHYDRNEDRRTLTHVHRRMLQYATALVRKRLGAHHSTTGAALTQAAVGKESVTPLRRCPQKSSDLHEVFVILHFGAGQYIRAPGQNVTPPAEPMIRHSSACGWHSIYAAFTGPKHKSLFAANCKPEKAAHAPSQSLSALSDSVYTALGQEAPTPARKHVQTQAIRLHSGIMPAAPPPPWF
eukprot:353695-Chlamydomonas_euryale.AAC.14